jgi:hypothetical protein
MECGENIDIHKTKSIIANKENELHNQIYFEKSEKNILANKTKGVAK